MHVSVNLVTMAINVVTNVKCPFMVKTAEKCVLTNVLMGNVIILRENVHSAIQAGREKIVQRNVQKTHGASTVRRRVNV